MRQVQKSLGELPPSAFNDPARVVTAILAAVDADTPPLRLATGGYAAEQMRAALTARLGNLDAWGAVTAAVDEPAA